MCILGRYEYDRIRPKDVHIHIMGMNMTPTSSVQHIDLPLILGRPDSFPHSALVGYPTGLLPESHWSIIFTIEMDPKYALCLESASHLNCYHTIRRSSQG